MACIMKNEQNLMRIHNVSVNVVNKYSQKWIKQVCKLPVD